jgi:hypothetical protein
LEILGVILLLYWPTGRGSFKGSSKLSISGVPNRMVMRTFDSR